MPKKFSNFYRDLGSVSSFLPFLPRHASTPRFTEIEEWEGCTPESAGEYRGSPVDSRRPSDLVYEVLMEQEGPEDLQRIARLTEEGVSVSVMFVSSLTY